jgi:hypothetical protein
LGELQQAVEALRAGADEDAAEEVVEAGSDPGVASLLQEPVKQFDGRSPLATNSRPRWYMQREGCICNEMDEL